MRRLKWFTLVEMLIVIVIIWILAGAILPKIMEIQARARDTKRITDLKNVAMAVQSYKMDNGEYPKLDDCWWEFCWFCTMFWDVKRLKGSLSDYIKQIPQDPQKNNTIKIHHTPLNRYKAGIWSANDTYWHWKNRKKWWHAQNPGQYLYQIFEYNWDNYWAAVLAAKVETPWMANYVLAYPQQKSNLWWAWSRFDNFNWCREKTRDKIENLYLCTSVEKWNRAEWIDEWNWNYKCIYSSEDQLYYVMEV